MSRNCNETIIDQFIEELRKKLPTEDMFINSFKNVGWSHHASIYEGEKNKTRVQTVLEVLERYKNHGICIDDFTIEHILPDGESQSNGQIGNLIPLENFLNEKCKDKPLQEKISVYRQSAYFTARSFSTRFTEGSFDPEKRTEYMAKEFYEKILKL